MSAEVLVMNKYGEALAADRIGALRGVPAVGVAVDTAKAWPLSEHSSAKGRGHVSVRSRLSSG